MAKRKPDLVSREEIDSLREEIGMAIETAILARENKNGDEDRKAHFFAAILRACYMAKEMPLNSHARIRVDTGPFGSEPFVEAWVEPPAGSDGTCSYAMYGKPFDYDRKFPCA